MDRKKDKNTALSFMKNKGVLPLILIFAVLGIILLLLGSQKNSESVSKNPNDSERLQEYTKELEEKIAHLCEKVRGASNVSVTVYLDSGFETIYAYDEENKISSSGTNSEKKYVTLGSGNDESMVSILEKAPNICGIAIVCSGGSRADVSSDIIGLISSAYGIPKNKIYVAEAGK